VIAAEQQDPLVVDRPNLIRMGPVLLARRVELSEDLADRLSPASHTRAGLLRRFFEHSGESKKSSVVSEPIRPR
jgi:hypothetical protein